MKKGFTLVELLAVITVLAILALVIVPTVIGNLEKGKEATYLQQTKILEETAERWSVRNAGILEENTKNYLEIETLVNEGYLANDDIIDPRDNTKMKGCIIITFEEENNQFSFQYVENTCSTLKASK